MLCKLKINTLKTYCFGTSDILNCHILFIVQHGGGIENGRGIPCGTVHIYVNKFILKLYWQKMHFS